MIYLDYQATTPVDARVLEQMLPWFSTNFGNPHSSSHRYGWDAAAAVESARARVAGVINADPREIVFTSGATEANNLAIKGAARFLKGQRNRIVTVATEHKCVLESVKALAAEGFSVELLPVEPSGRLDPARLEAALTPDVALVTVMAANNEIGVIQDLAMVGRLARAAGVVFHTDAAQAFGKIPLDVQALGIDLMSISGHKIYGPKGIGALYVRHRPRVRLEPLFSGGGQERGLRSGTLAPALCIGLGSAAEIAEAERESDASRVRGLAARLLAGLPDVILNGDPVNRLSGNLNLRLVGVAASALMDATPEVALSMGSACTSTEIEPSYVLRAIGLNRDEASSSLRISLGRQTTAAEIDRAIVLMARSLSQLRGSTLRPRRSAAN